MGKPGVGALRIFFQPRTLRESVAKNKSTRHLLLMGMSRTGTSILRTLLNAHPDVIVTYESIYRPFCGRNRPSDVEAYYYEVTKQYRHLCGDQQHAEPNRTLKPATYDKAYEYFGDKAIYDPSPQLRRDLKRSIRSKRVDRVIFIVRDPRARFLSLMEWRRRMAQRLPATVPDGAAGRAARDPESLARFEAQKWIYYTDDVVRFTEHGSPCTCLRYEDLVASPTETMARLWDFLELDAGQCPEGYCSQVFSGSADRWRQELDAQVIRSIEAAAGTDRLRRFSYDSWMEADG